MWKIAPYVISTVVIAVLGLTYNQHGKTQYAAGKAYAEQEAAKAAMEKELQHTRQLAKMAATYQDEQYRLEQAYEAQDKRIQALLTRPLHRGPCFDADGLREVWTVQDGDGSDANGNAAK